MNVPSVLDAVTVYREGALCTRLVRADPRPASDPPSHELRVTGLPLSLEPGSLRARVVSGPPGLTVHGVQPAFEVELADEVDVPLETRQLEQARDSVAGLQLALDRVELEIAELEALRPRFREPKAGDPPRPAAVSSMIALADFATARLDERLARRRDLERRLDDADAQVRLRERRLVEAGTARRSERARTSRAVVITLSAPVSGPLELAVEYQVPGARWTPAYEMQLDRGLTAGVLRMRASVAQRTGEDWAGVRLSLSTASLLRRADLPELRSLRIGRAQAEPWRTGFREPPPGLDDLFASWDEAMRAAPPVERQVAEPPLAPRLDARDDRRARRLARTQQGMPVQAAASPGAARAELRASRGEGFERVRPVRVSAAPDTSGVHGPPPPAAAPQPAMPSPAAPAGPMLGAAMGTGPFRGWVARAGQARDEDTAETISLGFDTGAPAAIAAERTLDTALLDYDRLRLGGPDAGAHRGRLFTAPEHEVSIVAGLSIDVEMIVSVVTRARSEAASVSRLAVPAGCRPAAALDAFDYRYDCAGRADVPSTGGWVSVAVMSCDVGLVPEFVCVPGVDPKVYRTVLVRNTSPHALLAGPCDVSAGDEFLLTAPLPSIPPGGDQQHLGLGVEEAIKVARRLHFRETTGGLFGGATLLVHDLDIEINNRLATPVKLDVRERVPVAHAAERDLKIEDGEARPPWEKVDGPLDGAVVSGARRWRVTVGACERVSLTAQYTIRIPGDRMLVGGNRRG